MSRLKVVRTSINGVRVKLVYLNPEYSEKSQ